MKKIRKKFIKIINKNESSWINLLILSFIALIIKQVCTYITYKNLNYWSDFYINSFFTDAIIVLIIFWIIILNQYTKNRIIKTFNNLICFVIFIIFCIDTFTIYFLQSRVSIFEAFSYVNNWWNGFTSIVIQILIIILLLRILLLIITKNIRQREKQTRYILRAIFLIFWWLTLNLSKPKEISNIIRLNVSYIKGIQQNITIDNKENVADTEIQNEKQNEKIIKTSYKDYIGYEKWDWKELNIILVFAESISAIDSANMWWHDNMPWFDKIQNNGIKFTNFIENWATSDTAHISTLFWIIPLASVWTEETPYTGYKLIMAPLPQFLNSQWYNTTFISAASLAFLEQREFLKLAWFQKIIWEEEFKNKKKYAFDAASDGDLFERTLEEIKNQTWKYFIWLQTISFHKPYNSPIWKTEKLALQYSDGELYKFYESLVNMWFFDNWILIILWDHRKMDPAEAWEYDLMWWNRYTRPVATIVWSWINKWAINNNIIQHTDFYNSIKRIIWKWNVQIDKNYNDIFQKSINRNWWLTSASHFDNKYIVSYIDKTWFTFNNVSNLTNKDNDLYNYFLNYYNYQLSDEQGQEENNEYTENNESNENTKQILIWHQWARNYETENTLQSFIKAKKQWANWIEFDVSYTKDKKNIVAHWEYLSASNCSNKKIWNYTYEWIKENCTLKNWETYKTLTEMLEMIDGLFDYYFVEIKVYNESLWEKQALEAIETVKKLNMQDRVIFISYSNAARKILNKDPDIIFWRDTFDINDLDFIWENNSKYFLAPYDILTSEAINKAKNLWKEVVTYTINDTWNYEKMVDYWVNIILTDDIKLLKEDNYKK